MSTDTSDKPKRKILQLRTTDEFERQLNALMDSTGLRKKSATIFFAVKETYDRRISSKS